MVWIIQLFFVSLYIYYKSKSFCVVMSVLINVKAIDSLLIVPPFYVRGILCGRPD